MIKYRVIKGLTGIKKIEVERETNNFVVFKDGRKDAKRSNCWNYFPTFLDAKVFALGCIKDDIEKTLIDISFCEKKIEKLKSKLEIAEELQESR